MKLNIPIYAIQIFCKNMNHIKVKNNDKKVSKYIKFNRSPLYT